MPPLPQGSDFVFWSLKAVLVIFMHTSFTYFLFSQPLHNANSLSFTTEKCSLILPFKTHRSDNELTSSSGSTRVQIFQRPMKTSFGNVPVISESELPKVSEFPVFDQSLISYHASVLSRNTWNLAPTEEIGVFQGGYVAFNGRRKVWMRTKGSRSTIAVKLPRFIGCLLVIDLSRRNLFIMGRSADGILVWLRLKTSWSVRLCLFSYDS